MKVEMYKEFIKEIKKYEKLDKGYVIDVLNSYVNGNKFLEHLNDFLEMRGDNQQYYGVIFSDEMDEDDDEYFGENKIMFYYGEGDNDYNIIGHEECYKYLEATGQFYINYYKENEEIIIDMLKKIKKKYCGLELV